MKLNSSLFKIKSTLIVSFLLSKSYSLLKYFKGYFTRFFWKTLSRPNRSKNNSKDISLQFLETLKGSEVPSKGFLVVLFLLKRESLTTTVLSLFPVLLFLQLIKKIKIKIIIVFATN